MLHRPQPPLLRLNVVLVSLMTMRMMLPMMLMAGSASARAETAPASYVDDAVCATCHAPLAASYQDVGMSHAFADAASANEIETYSTPEHPEAGRFFHGPSQRWYEMRRSSPEARPTFRRWLVDDEGRPVDLFEAEVDWILGSGHTSRSYLLHQPGGELFVLPVAWYSQGSHWGMAPGFDDPVHVGLQRRVRLECMFCHNAYPPDVTSQPDRYGDPHLYPKDLPQGTGCQRCHGPGSRHVEAAYTGGLDDYVRSEIVNPGKLEPTLRDDVCEQCHLQPSVAFMPVRRFGRRIYSYRPGERLDDYIVYFDPEEEAARRDERFEINHHPYRLRQSACFLTSRAETSETGLSCLTCHDPHRKVPAAKRAEHYRQACLSCHDVDACGLPHRPASAPLPLHMRGVDPADCATCHMPRRRTRDVVHVVITDHRIAKLPGGESPEESLLAPLEEFTPVLVDMDYYVPGSEPAGPLAAVYRAYAVEKAGGNEDSQVQLDLMVPASGTEAVEPWLQNARAQMQGGRVPRAEQILRAFLKREPGHVRALTWLALTLSSSDPEASLGYLEQARELSTFEDPDLYYNLGVLSARTGREDAALRSLQRTVELRPLHAAGWLQLGLLHERRQHLDLAAQALRTSLDVEPRASRTRRALAQVLAKDGKREEAVRVLRVGLGRSDDSEGLQHALRLLEAPSGLAVDGIKSSDGPAEGSERQPVEY